MWRSAKKILGSLVPAVLLSFLVAILVCRLNQWDLVVPLTLIPFWVWGSLGTLSSVVSWLTFRNAASFAAFAIWILATVGLSEETIGIARELRYALRTEKPASRFDRDRGVLRLVTLHCCERNETAARESLSLAPDIVFLQGTPSEDQLEEISTELFGLDGITARSETGAIIARGKFVTQSSPGEPGAVHARLRLPDGDLLDLSNVNFDRTLPSWRLWSADVWDDLTLQRKGHRKQIRRYLGDYGNGEAYPPRFVAGHFGTPPGDDIFRPLARAGLRDAYRLRGKDWGNTYPPGYPVYRIDQVWASPEIEVIALRTRFSDQTPHRIVICDFRLRAEPEEP